MTIRLLSAIWICALLSSAYLAFWYALAACAFWIFGIETRGARSRRSTVLSANPRQPSHNSRDIGTRRRHRGAGLALHPVTLAVLTASAFQAASTRARSRGCKVTIPGP